MERQATKHGTGVRTLGVVGAGTMGAGIAQTALLAGFAVVLCDAVPHALARAQDDLASRLERLAEKGQLQEPPAAVLKRLTCLPTTSDLGGLIDAEAVIEAVVEDLAVKQALFAQLDAVCPAATLLASNTSSLSVTALAKGLRHPERVLGLHFFNPAPRMPLVEVVRADTTARETLEQGVALARALGKEPVVVQDTPGFIVNRVARPFYGEALRLLAEGAADAPAIDRIVRAAGFRMGPFELMDLIGLDVNLAVTQSVYAATFENPRYRPHPLQARMVASGRLGRKSGWGFYQYDQR